MNMLSVLEEHARELEDYRKETLKILQKINKDFKIVRYRCYYTDKVEYRIGLHEKIYFDGHRKKCRMDAQAMLIGYLLGRQGDGIKSL